MGQLRDTSDYTFNDQLFDHQMNLKITETNQNYDRMLFKGIQFFLQYRLVLSFNSFRYCIYRGSSYGILRVPGHSGLVQRNDHGEYESKAHFKIH